MPRGQRTARKRCWLSATATVRPEREIVKEAILQRVSVKDVVILDTAGVSTMYANDGGVIVVL